MLHLLLLRRPPFAEFFAPSPGSMIKSWLSKMPSLIFSCGNSSQHLVSSVTQQQRYASLSRTVELVKNGQKTTTSKRFHGKSFSDPDMVLSESAGAIARVQTWTLTHAYYVNMGGLVARKRIEQWNSSSSIHSHRSVAHSYSIVRADHLADPKLKHGSSPPGTSAVCQRHQG